jgi:hypothetical protein
LLDVPSNYKKVFLTGTKDMNIVHNYLKSEGKPVDTNSVEMYYTKTVQEYDELLSKNIVFINLYDASANNAILECIIRNTPILVNKVGGVVEYLGPDYPLYYNNLNEIHGLLNKVTLAHEYLKNMDKSEFTMEFFYKKLMNSLINSI